MIFTRDALVRWHAGATRFADSLLAAMDTAKINTAARQCHFLAQVAHESGGFRAVVENLNYSQDALRRVFGKYFPTESAAADYARQPERIASRVYANRLGNGDEASGDGWRFRGRGLIQVTGRENYRVCSVALFGDTRLWAQPELLEHPRHACESAAWFWTSRDLNGLADVDGAIDACAAITRKVNGGTHGLEDRRQWLDRARRALTTGG